MNAFCHICTVYHRGNRYPESHSRRQAAYLRGVRRRERLDRLQGAGSNILGMTPVRSTADRWAREARRDPRYVDAGVIAHDDGFFTVRTIPA